MHYYAIHILQIKEVYLESMSQDKCSRRTSNKTLLLYNLILFRFINLSLIKQKLINPDKINKKEF